MKKFFGTRYGFAVLYLLISFSLTLIIGGLLSLITKDFFYTIGSIFYLFFAFPCVSALLLIFTNIEEDLSYGFGAGLYYGTIGVAAFIDWLNWHITNCQKLFCGFVVSSLVCYIVYLERFSPRK